MKYQSPCRYIHYLSRILRHSRDKSRSGVQFKRHDTCASIPKVGGILARACALSALAAALRARASAPAIPIACDCRAFNLHKWAEVPFGLLCICLRSAVCRLITVFLMFSSQLGGCFNLPQPTH
ncbi:hypothetical protein Y032_0168g196 [Ancylostoma ceylanicum]|uniref:Uncharacterized protein n=1 Tax=Ancylostoma ceylanicum TaxID=53326 RepID=A0A016SWG4_9BILA|nr:hypothetical protein Y032_0168g196 [Ancylostoma ceylanicum]